MWIRTVGSSQRERESKRKRVERERERALYIYIYLHIENKIEYVGCSSSSPSRVSRTFVRICIISRVVVVRTPTHQHTNTHKQNHIHRRPLAELHFRHTSDGTFLISACLDKNPMLRDGVTGDWIGTFSGHKGAVWSAKLNADATKAVTGSADFSVKLWNAITGKSICTYDHKHIVKTVDFDPSGKRILSGGMEKKLRVFDISSSSSSSPILEMKRESTVRKALWQDENSILMASDDGQVSVVDVRSSTVTKSAKIDTGSSRIMDMEMSSSSKTNILTVASGKGVSFLDSKTLKQIKRYKYPISIEAASLHPTGKYFCAGGEDMWVRLFDYATGEELECQKGHHGPIHCLRFTPDGTSYCSGSGDATIRMWPSKKLGGSVGVGSEEKTS